MSQNAGDTVAAMARRRRKAFGLSAVGFVLIMTGAGLWYRRGNERRLKEAEVSQQLGTNSLLAEDASQLGEAKAKQRN